jgi:hypothetical protein
VIGASDSDHQAIAAYCEASTVASPHYYGVTTSEAGCLVPGSTGDIAYILSQLKYNKTAVQYSSTDPYAIMSYLARILTTAWLGNNTTITLKFKLEPGVVPETISNTAANTLDAKNCNVYVNYQNGTAFIEEGTSCSGNWTDLVIGADWLAGEIQTAVFNALYGTPTKIPQTDAGMNQLIVAMASACGLAVNNGFCAPGIWFSAGFGTLSFGQNLPTGFYIWAGPMALQSEAVRQTRAAPIAQIALKTSGAIQSSLIQLVINQ